MLSKKSQGCERAEFSIYSTSNISHSVIAEKYQIQTCSHVAKCDSLAQKQ